MEVKGEKIRVVDMCKYVDEHAYLENLTKEEKDKIGEYLYYIIFAISDHKGYFYDSRDCEDFSNYLASSMYKRLTSPKQFGENPKLDKIVSCKNYINEIIYGRMLQWQQNFKFSEVMEDESELEDYVFSNKIDVAAYKNTLRESVMSSDRKALEDLIISEIGELPKIISKVCRKTPYRSDAKMVHNLEMTCLLNMLNRVTLSNKVLKTINNLANNDRLFGYQVAKSRMLNLDEPIILWHLDDNMEEFVRVLLNRIKKMFSESIAEICQKFYVQDDILDALVFKESDVKYD